ncbi:MAG: PAS domain S-box protein, partial [Deltaproteobacteria bacterium]
MAAKPTYEELERRIQQLQKAESEYRRKEDILQESEKKYRNLSGLLHLLCDNVPDMIWAKDLEKKYIFANRAICKNLLNAADTEEPIGKTDIFFAERERGRFPDNLEWHTFGEICRDTDQITMEAGIPMQFDEFGNVNGQFLFLDVHKAPFIDEYGKMIGTVGSARDITEQKRAEKALQESEERFRNLMENIDAVAVQGYGPDGTTQYWNKASERLYGYKQQEAIGCNLLDLIIPSEMKDYVAKAIREMAESGRPIPSGEVLLMHKDGSRVPVISHHAIVKVPGREQELFCLDVDITARKQADEALRKSEWYLRSTLDGLSAHIAV